MSASIVRAAQLFEMVGAVESIAWDTQMDFVRCEGVSIHRTIERERWIVG